MGERTVMQEALSYEFSLERHVPSDHLLRSIDRFVDLSGSRCTARGITRVCDAGSRPFGHPQPPLHLTPDQ